MCAHTYSIVMTFDLTLAIVCAAGHDDSASPTIAYCTCPHCKKAWDEAPPVSYCTSSLPAVCLHRKGQIVAADLHIPHTWTITLLLLNVLCVDAMDCLQSSMCCECVF